MPAELRELYATAFEVETKWIVEAGARRQKWIDQAQSLNIYMAGASGKKLDETYKLAWLRGLKTTYYLRTLAATSAEKSTGKGGELNVRCTASAARIVERQCTRRTGGRGVGGKAGATSSTASRLRTSREVCADRRSDVRGLPVIASIPRAADAANIGECAKARLPGGEFREFGGPRSRAAT